MKRQASSGRDTWLSTVPRERRDSQEELAAVLLKIIRQNCWEIMGKRSSDVSGTGWRGSERRQQLVSFI